MSAARSRPAALVLALVVGACSRGSAPQSPAGADQVADVGAQRAPVAGAPAAPSGAAPDLDAGAMSTPAVASAPADPSDAGTLAPDGGAPAPPPAPISTAVAVFGGQDVSIERDGGTLVDAGASFRVEIAVPLTDGRLALHDEQDAMVASSGTSEVGASWTRYRLVPDEPLRPGTTYVLRVDGATTREVHDPAGRAYAPLTLKLKTSGERPAPAPARKKRGKRRS